MNPINDFLRKYSISKDDKTTIPNHTSIKGGKYLIPEDQMATFNEYYIRQIWRDKNMMYLVETQEGNAMMVDLDFRYEYAVKEKQHNDDFKLMLLDLYCQEIQKFYKFTNETEFNIYVLEKASVNTLQNSTETKDGIHLCIGIKIPHNIQILIRENMIKNKDVIELFSQLPLTNDLESVFDKGLSTGKTSHQKLGSRKPDNLAYEIQKILKMGYDETDGEMMQNEIQLSIEKQVEMCSTKYKHNPELELIWSASQSNPDTDNETISNASAFSNCSSVSNKSNYLYLKKGIQKGLLNDSTKTYPEWFEMECIIKNTFGETEEGFEIWDDICKIKKDKYDKEGSRDSYLKHKDPNKKPKTIASAIQMMKDKNLDLFNELKKEVKDELYPKKAKIETKKETKEEKLENAIVASQSTGFEFYEDPEVNEAILNMIRSNTDVQVAKMIVKLFGDDFVFIDDKKWVIWKNKIWNETKGESVRSIISCEFTEFVSKIIRKLNLTRRPDMTKDENQSLMDLIQPFNKLVEKSEKTSDKNNIFKEMSELKKDESFMKDMNNAIYFIPLKNGLIINTQTLEVRERTITDKFSYECDINYMAELTEEQTKYCADYFESLFCGDKPTTKSFIDVIKTCMSGVVLRHMFFLTGSGRNGKSTLFKLLGAMCNKGMDTISKAVILQTKSTSNINTEIEKLNKIRIGYVSELTSDDKLNVANIKCISGRDPMDLRGLQTTNATIQPTTNLFALTNNLPECEFDDATADRLRIYPLDNKFKVNGTYEDEVISNRDQLFSYIMQQGEFIIGDVVATDLMRIAGQEYANENNTLKQFVEEKIEICEESLTKPKKIKSGDFIEAYYSWCQQHKVKIMKCSKTKFTQNLKAKFGINSKEGGGFTHYLNIDWKREIVETECLINK